MTAGTMQPAGVATSRRSGERASRLGFLGVSTLLFAAAVAGTVAWCASMPTMGGTPMPGGGAMPALWAPTPGQPWPLAGASFLGMWIVMTVAMMLPSLIPTLWRRRDAMSRAGGSRPGPPAALAGLGYFTVWTGFGAAAFPVGAALAMVAMHQPAVAGALPVAAGAVVVVAGCFQLTAVKARHLACCRDVPGQVRPLPDGAGAAWRHGLRLGLRCVRCCAGLMAVLLVIGVTDLRAMAVVAVAITAERLAPAGHRVARAIGVVLIGAGPLLIARAAGLG